VDAVAEAWAFVFHCVCCLLFIVYCACCCVPQPRTSTPLSNRHASRAVQDTSHTSHHTCGENRDFAFRVRILKTALSSFPCPLPIAVHHFIIHQRYREKRSRMIGRINQSINQSINQCIAGMILRRGRRSTEEKTLPSTAKLNCS
jgi:hypothetical protein